MRAGRSLQLQHVRAGNVALVDADGPRSPRRRRRARSEECAPPGASVRRCAPNVRAALSERRGLHHRRRGLAGARSSRSGSLPAARARSTHGVCAWRRRRASPSGSRSMCAESAGSRPIAQRAAIGRRLAVLGRTDLPPRGGGKAHRRRDGWRSRKYTRPHSMAARRLLLPSSARPATLADAARAGADYGVSDRPDWRTRGVAQPAFAPSPSTAAACTSWTCGRGSGHADRADPRPRRALAELARDDPAPRLAAARRRPRPSRVRPLAAAARADLDSALRADASSASATCSSSTA